MPTLKELFEKAEGGTLTYEQLVALAPEAKFVDLSGGDYVSTQKYNDELAKRDTRITSLDETVKARDTDLQTLRTQLEAAGTDATKLTDLTSKFDELQKQYDKDTKAYQKQLKDQEYRFAVTEFANQQKFSSKAAKKQFEAELIERKLQVDNGVILGATDFLAAYRAENEDSFEADKVEPETPSNPKPHFVDTTKSQGNSTDEPQFNFNFAGVRPHK